MRHAQLLWRFLRLSMLQEVAYRHNFFLQFLQSLLTLGSGLLGLTMIVDHTSSLNGWNGSELLVLLGVYQLVGAFIQLIIQPAMQRLMRDVRQGALDFTLLKPVDAQFLVSVQDFQLWKLGDALLSLGVIGVGLSHLSATLTLGRVLAFLIMLGAGLALIYSFWLALATCAFWLVRVDNVLVIFQDLYQAGRWPVDIYPPWLRWLLVLLVPVAVATTVPVQALLGQLTLPTLLSIVLVAALALLLARWFWLYGLRHYTGASA